MEPNTIVRSFIIGISRGSSMSQSYFGQEKKGLMVEHRVNYRARDIQSWFKRRKRVGNLSNIFSNKMGIYSTCHLHSSCLSYCNYCCPSYFLCCSIDNYLELPTRETERKYCTCFSTWSSKGGWLNCYLNITLRRLHWAGDKRPGYHILRNFMNCEMKMAA